MNRKYYCADVTPKRWTLVVAWVTVALFLGCHFMTRFMIEQRQDIAKQIGQDANLVKAMEGNPIKWSLVAFSNLGSLLQLLVVPGFIFGLIFAARRYFPMAEVFFVMLFFYMGLANFCNDMAYFMASLL